MPSGHRLGPTEAAAETEAPPRRRGYGGVLSPAGDTKGGLSPFEEIKREKLPISVLPYGGGGKSSKNAPSVPGGAVAPLFTAFTF